MRRLPALLASCAAAACWLTAAAALAQPVQVQGEGAGVVRLQVREQAAAIARQRSLHGMANQLRPFYRYELMHARTACKLTKEQLQRIRPEADAAYEAAIAGLQNGNEASRSPDGEEPDYRKDIHEAVFFVVVRHASREQAAALEADLRRRAASRKEAGVPLLVAVLDRQLLLTGQQREEIARSLSAHWDDRWCDGLEAAFTMGSRWPAVPDGLVVPYLSATQQECWRQIPRIRGRLWGVVIDHGGDAAMEQELGAAGDKRPGAPAPRNGGELPVARIVPQPAPARPQAVVRAVPVQRLEVVVPARAIRRPAGAVQPAAPGDMDEDPDDEVGRAERLRRQEIEQTKKMLEQHYRTLLDRQVFGNPAGEPAALAQLELALAKRVDELIRAGGLTDAQRTKLRAAGRGDIKRFFDRVAETRERIRESLAEGGRVGAFMEDVPTLKQEHGSLMKVEGPLFSAVLPRTLTGDQREAIEKDARDRLAFRHRADVRWTAVLLARSLGLVDDQRRRLESLLLDRAVAPKKFDGHDYMDYAIVMYQASRIPESDLRPIFDDLQWRVLAQELAAARQWELYLRRGGFFEDGFFDSRDAPLPPIHLLDPSRMRSR